jgi:hypothetical protein
VDLAEEFRNPLALQDARPLEGLPALEPLPKQCIVVLPLDFVESLTAEGTDLFDGGGGPGSRPDGFAIDSGVGSKASRTARELQRAGDDWVTPVQGSAHLLQGLEDKGKQAKFDQFTTAAEMGVKTRGFEEEAYTTRLDPSKFTKEQQAMAARVAREIEGNTSGGRVRQHDRGQTEAMRDVSEEDAFSSVQRTAPVYAPGVYVPPQHRPPKTDEPTTTKPGEGGSAVVKESSASPSPPTGRRKLNLPRDVIKDIQGMPSFPRGGEIKSTAHPTRRPKEVGKAHVVAKEDLMAFKEKMDKVIKSADDAKEDAPPPKEKEKKKKMLLNADAPDFIPDEFMMPNDVPDAPPPNMMVPGRMAWGYAPPAMYHIPHSTAPGGMVGMHPPHHPGSMMIPPPMGYGVHPSMVPPVPFDTSGFDPRGGHVRHHSGERRMPPVGRTNGRPPAFVPGPATAVRPAE